MKMTGVGNARGWMTKEDVDELLLSTDPILQHCVKKGGLCFMYFKKRVSRRTIRLMYGVEAHRVIGSYGKCIEKLGEAEYQYGSCPKTPSECCRSGIKSRMENYWRSNKVAE